MKGEFAALSYVPLESGVASIRPPQLPELVHLDSPAVEVMTDFNVVQPVTVAPDASIDDALGRMKSKGVRLLLVTDSADQVVGLITANDIQGEKPIKLVEEDRIARADISVEMVMTPQSRITALNMVSVRNAQVGHIVETMHALERQHTLVVDVDPDTRRQRICGMFSTTQIGKQLGREVSGDLPAAHSLAEMQHEIG